MDLCFAIRVWVQVPHVARQHVMVRWVRPSVTHQFPTLFDMLKVETIDGDLNIFDAANKFIQSKRRRFPIVENGKLVGQISQKDILKAAMNLKGQNWK